MTAESVLFLPCNEGSGLTLTNTVPPGTKTAGNLAATAWDNYDPASRPAVSLTTQIAAADVINQTPYNYFGSETQRAPYQPMSFGLFRFSPTFNSSIVRFGAGEEAHQFVSSDGSSFALRAGQGDVWTSAHPAQDIAYAFGIFTEPVGANQLRSVWAVIRFDPTDWSELAANSGVATNVENDPSGDGYFDDGGYVFDDLHLLCSAGPGNSIEMYGLQHSRVLTGQTPSAARSPEAMTAAVRDAVAAWSVGNKVVPNTLLASGVGSSVRNRARRAGARR